VGCCGNKSEPAPPSVTDFFQMDLEQKYQHLLNNWSDIQDALPHLRRFASECRHLTEFGIRTANSTTAFLASQPEALISYDIGLDLKYLQDLDRVKGSINFQYRQGDTREINIEPTHLLFIDTLHTYQQLNIELKRHAGKVMKYLIFHDTWGFRFNDEVETPTEKKGLWPAIQEMLDTERCWENVFELTSGFGLTVLKRKMQHL
jgi:hypothetical protein